MQKEINFDYSFFFDHEVFHESKKNTSKELKLKIYKLFMIKFIC